MTKRLAIPFIALSLSCGLGFLSNMANADTTVSLRDQIELPDFSAIYDSVGKAVVNILVTKEATAPVNGLGNGDPRYDFLFKRMIPPQQQRRYLSKTLGSGFIIGADGYILTNAHVVSNARTITVKLYDKREFTAKVVGIDTKTDVAVVKINVTSLPIIKIGDPSLMKPGNWVVAIGSPFGLENTITQGTISSMSRSLPDDTYVPFIQTDVPINPGNSGGPLINLKGEVIGINSQIYSRSGGFMGISFAIPINYAMLIAKELEKNGRVIRGRLGVSVQALTPDLAKSFGLPDSASGVLINSVEPNSAAYKAGLKVGDVILDVNGSKVTDATQLPRLVSQLGPNKKLTCIIWRNGVRIVVTAITGTEDDKAKSTNLAGNNKVIPLTKMPHLGITVQELTDAIQLPSGINYAVLINGVSMSAQISGIRQGDLIIGIGNHFISSMKDFKHCVAKYHAGQVVPLKILRGDERQYWSFFVAIKVLSSVEQQYNVQPEPEDNNEDGD